MRKWISAGKNKYGLQYREDDTKVTGVGRSKRALRYYRAVVKLNGKTVSDVFGWENCFSGGAHEIEMIHLQLRMNRKSKTPPFTYKQMLQERQEALDQKEAAEAQAKLEDEQLIRTVFDVIFNEYHESLPETRSTIEMLGFYRKWLIVALGSMRLEDIKLLDLQRVQKTMEKAGKAPRTIKTVKEIVRQVYNYAIEHELYTGVKPTDNFLRKQKLNNSRAEYYTVEQTQALLDELHKHSLQTYRIALLSLNTGMRFGEIASLRWQHVNLERELILIVDPKNGENRTAYMLEPVRKMFSEMHPGAPGELVFPDKNGCKMGKVSNTFPKAVSALGFNDGITDRRLRLGFHSLRHTAASWLANSGVEMQIIAKILGHKTLAMTMRYSHISDLSVQSAMKLLESQTPQENVISINGSGSRK
jgi:integrase